MIFFFFVKHIYVNILIVNGVIKNQWFHSLPTYRKSGQRAIEELQRTLVEVETRYKSEISRLKKKYETDIRELEAALDNANRANAEYLKQIKALQAKNKVCYQLIWFVFRSIDKIQKVL